VPGVYRDDRGGYSYQSANFYEDRRRDDWDRSYGSLRPMPPAPPPSFSYHPQPIAFPAPAPEPAAAAAAPPPPPPVAVLQPASAINFNDLDWQSPAEPALTFPQVAHWPGPEQPRHASAVDFHELNQFVTSLPAAPARVGDIPEFDAAFDPLTADGRSITYLPYQDSLLAPAGTEWVPFE
jgi:hypothetical protein